MDRYKISRIMLAATGSGCGKTMITCGLLEILKIRLSTVAFKCGPDYIDPMFHRYVLGIDSRNLDTFFTDTQTTRYLLARAAMSKKEYHDGAGMYTVTESEAKTNTATKSENKACDSIAVIEGVMGYYDGLGGVSVTGSSYDLAKQTKTPVVLVVDGSGMSLSILAVIRGFLEMYPQEPGICGVIINKISEPVYERLKPMIEELGIAACGYVPRTDVIHFPGRHLGLVMPTELDKLKEQIADFAALMQKTVDIERILHIASQAEPIEYEPVIRKSEAKGVRIGIPRDEAFCFYYRDNLELLRELGAELTYFSPLKDESLPDGLAGLYMGGGYPELHAKELSENISMKKSIAYAIESGMPCLAECGAYMYLHEEMEDAKGVFYPMVGVVPGQTLKKERLVRFGYAMLNAVEDNLLGPAGMSMPTHEFHYWDSTVRGGCMEARKPLTDRRWSCGYKYKNLLAGFPHMYFYANPLMAEIFVEKCREYVKKV